MILICRHSNDGVLSYKPYKIVVATKLLHNFTNFKPEDPPGYKKNSNSTTILQQLLSESYLMEQDS